MTTAIARPPPLFPRCQLYQAALARSDGIFGKGRVEAGGFHSIVYSRRAAKDPSRLQAGETDP